MSSIKCQSCGLVNFANAGKCKRCKKPLVSVPSQSWTPPDPSAYAASKSSDAKTLLKLLPFVIFGVPMFLALKDRIFSPPAKVGGHVDTLQLTVLTVCTLGLVVTTIVIVLTRKK